MGDLDGSCCSLVEGQLFPAGPSEADGAPVVTRSFIQPGHGVLAGVSEPLMGCSTQQLQEGQLDHAHRGAISIHVGELQWSKVGSGAPAPAPAEERASQSQSTGRPDTPQIPDVAGDGLELVYVVLEIEPNAL